MHGSRGRDLRVRALHKNYKDIGSLRNTGPDPLGNHKATQPIDGWAITGPLIVVYWVFIGILVQTPIHSSKFATITESGNGSGVCKEHYA